MLQIAELVLSSIVLMFMPPLLMFMAYSQTLADRYGYPEVMGWEFVGTLNSVYILLGFLLPDIFLTVFAAIALRRPGFLLLAPLFPLLRFLEAYVCLRAMPKAWRTHSSGRWISPERRSTMTPGRHRITEPQPPTTPLGASTCG